MPDCGTSSQASNQSFNQTSQTTFAPASAEENALRQQFGQLGQQQLGYLNQLGSMLNQSPYTLDPNSQALINTMQANDQTQLNLANKQYADYLSGGRGLRMSDTPISQQAFQQQALGQSNLLAQYANTRLNAGLTGNQFRAGLGLNLAGAMPSGLTAAYNPLFQQRMASGTTTSSGYGTAGANYSQPLMSSLLQGIQGVGSVASGLGAMGFGLGPTGGLGGLIAGRFPMGTSISS